MPVVLDYSFASIIVRRDAIDRRYAGGWSAFYSEIRGSSCIGDDLARLSFFGGVGSDYEDCISKLKAHGLQEFDEYGNCSDFAVVDPEGFVPAKCIWLETAPFFLIEKSAVARTGNPEAGVLVAWIRGNEPKVVPMFDRISRGDVPCRAVPGSIMLTHGDITKRAADVIVNSANTSLRGGRGVDGAIHRAAGPRLKAACAKLNGCKVGEAKLTPAFNLPAKYVIHTVGPVWRDGLKGEARSLASCYLNALRLANSVQAESIIFPCISTGVFGFPARDAAEVAINAVRSFLAETASAINVLFCCYDEKQGQHYFELLGMSSKHCCEISSFIAYSQSRQTVTKALEDARMATRRPPDPPMDEWTLSN